MEKISRVATGRGVEKLMCLALTIKAQFSHIQDGCFQSIKS